MAEKKNLLVENKAKLLRFIDVIRSPVICNLARFSKNIFKVPISYRFAIVEPLKSPALNVLALNMAGQDGFFLNEAVFRSLLRDFNHLLTYQNVKVPT